MVEQEPVDEPDRPPVRTLRRPDGWHIAESALVIALAGSTFAVHDVGYMLSSPYSTDEGWVVASTRYSIGDLRTLTASTPIGWTALQRAFLIGGAQRQRIEVLLFAALAVAAAWYLGRQLGWPNRWVAAAAGVLCGFAVLTVPAMLVSDELKQYTADGAASLILLGLTMRLDLRWSRRRLVELCVAILVLMLFSHAAVVVGIACLGSVAVVQLATRQWSRLRDAAIAGAATALAMFGLYELFDVPGQTPLLTHFWRAYYVPVHKGLDASVTMITGRFRAFRSYIGLGPYWVVWPLFLAGVVTMALARRFALALAVTMLVPELIVLSAAKKYPLLDPRTSTFVAVIIVVTAAIGVCGICALVLRRSVIVGAVLALAAVAGSLVQTHQLLRIHRLPHEDVRSPIAYLAAARGPGDVIVVNYASNWGFAYYWKKDTPHWTHNPAIGWQASYPPQDRIVITDDPYPPAVYAAMKQALALQETSPGSRVWLVLSHVGGTELAMWRIAMRANDVSAVRVGPPGLALVNAAPG